MSETRGASVAAGADPVRHRRRVELDAFADEGFALAVERLVLGVLGAQDRRQQAGPRAAAFDRMEGRRRPRDLLARAARELFADRLHDLPAPRHDLERLGDVFAEPGELSAIAGARGGDAL